MSDPILSIRLKKGDPSVLKGKLVAYVTVSPEEGDAQNPLAGLVHNGLLAVQANYVEQRTIRDFFREEFGISLEKGIREVIDQAKETGGLEGALDPEAVRERLESMKNADFIPIPAKVAHYTREEDILAADADIYFLGHFTGLTHAHLCVNSFPIMYQAYFREQEHRSLESEIHSLLETIEGRKPPAGAEEKAEAGADAAGPSIGTFEGNIKTHLLRELIPAMLYSRSDRVEHERARSNFHSFMRDFGFPADIEAILALVDSDLEHDAPGLHRLELLVAKVEALQREDYVTLEKIKRELKAP